MNIIESRNSISQSHRVQQAVVSMTPITAPVVAQDANRCMDFSTGSNDAQKVRLNPTEPYEIDLPYGVRLTVLPLTDAVYEASRAEGWREAVNLVQEYNAEQDRGACPVACPDLRNADVVRMMSELIYAKALAVHSVVAWDGVLNAEGTAPADVTPSAVRSLMCINLIAKEFLNRYSRPDSDALEHGSRYGAAGNLSRRSA